MQSIYMCIIILLYFAVSDSKHIAFTSLMWTMIVMATPPTPWWKTSKTIHYSYFRQTYC